MTSSLILLEPATATPLPGTSLAAQIRETLGDFPSISARRASTAAEAVSLAEGKSLILCEIREAKDAVQLLAVLKVLRSKIDAGLVRVLASSRLLSPALLRKLKQCGCTEAVFGAPSEQILRQVGTWIKSKQSSSDTAGREVAPPGLAFLVSEWMSRGATDISGMAHLFCAALSASCSGRRAELWGRSGSGWRLLGSSDFFSEPLGTFHARADGKSEPSPGPGCGLALIRAESPESGSEFEPGQIMGALVFEGGADELHGLLQAASRLARGLTPASPAATAAC